jgi:GAF domain-containing protein
VLGAITIQSVEAKAFDQADIAILQGVADVLATAIENIKLIQQLEKSLDESQKLHRQYFREAWKDISQEVENRQFSITNLPPIPSEPNQEKAGSEYSFPVVLRDQEIGQLLLELDSPELKNEDRAFIEAVTTQAAVALENIRLLEKNQRQADYERLLFEISRKVSRSTDLNTILQITLSELGQVMRATDGMIQLKVPAGEEEEKQR